MDEKDKDKSFINTYISQKIEQFEELHKKLYLYRNDFYMSHDDYIKKVANTKTNIEDEYALGEELVKMFKSVNINEHDDDCYESKSDWKDYFNYITDLYILLNKYCELYVELKKLATDKLNKDQTINETINYIVGTDKCILRNINEARKHVLAIYYKLFNSKIENIILDKNYVQPIRILKDENSILLVFRDTPFMIKIKSYGMHMHYHDFEVIVMVTRNKVKIVDKKCYAFDEKIQVKRFRLTDIYNQFEQIEKYICEEIII